MPEAIRLIVWVVLGVCAAAGAGMLDEEDAGRTDVAASAAPEVGLRRLHLVRPDLILYPMSYEVLC